MQQFCLNNFKLCESKVQLLNNSIVLTTRTETDLNSLFLNNFHENGVGEKLLCKMFYLNKRV